MLNEIASGLSVGRSAAAGRSREFSWQRVEVLRFRFLVDPDSESYSKDLELELFGSGSMLESDPPLESDLFWRFIPLILIQEASSVRLHSK